MPPFRFAGEFTPQGDQPTAIEGIVTGVGVAFAIARRVSSAPAAFATILLALPSVAAANDAASRRAALGESTSDASDAWSRGASCGPDGTESVMTLRSVA